MQAMLRQLDHVNIVVRDIRVMQSFYTRALGLICTRDVHIHGPWIDAVVGLSGVKAHVLYLDAPEGGCRLELIAYDAPAAPPVQDNPAQPHLPGLRHLAFRVDDIQAMARRVQEAGGTMLGQIQSVPDTQVTYEGGARKQLVYFLDPEGNLLELCRYA